MRNSLPKETALLLAMFFPLVFGLSWAEESKPEKKLVISGIIFQDDQFMRAILIGMRDAAKNLNVQLMEGNSYSKLDKEIELVNTYVSRKVDAICITPLSKTASIAALKKAYDKGIKIVTYNAPIEAEFPASYINSSQRDLGISTGLEARKYIQEKLKKKKKVKVAILAFKSQLPEMSDERVKGFLEKIKDLPGYEIVAQQDAWLVEDAIKRAGDIITATPDIDILFAANDGGTVGATMAVKNAGKAGKVAVFGVDASEQIADFVLSDDNILQATTAQQPYQIGYMSIEFAVNAIKGKAVDKTVVVPCITLSRNDPEKVKQYQNEIKLMVKGAVK